MTRELSMQEQLRWIESLKGEGQYFKKATKYAAEYIICNFDDTGTTISASKYPKAAIETKMITTPSPTAL